VVLEEVVDDIVVVDVAEIVVLDSEDDVVELTLVVELSVVELSVFVVDEVVVDTVIVLAVVVDV
jgi:hypothetical protein